MSIRNRELSQFGSFIHIDDASQSIGITTEATPNVGIGTTVATHKFTVVGETNFNGNVRVTGIVTATNFYGNGSTLSGIVGIATDGWVVDGAGITTTRNVGIGTTNATSALTVTGNGSFSGIITASRFVSTVASGTAPLTVSSTTLVNNLNADLFQGRTPPSGGLVGDTDSQTLINKTLTSPRINGIGASFVGSTSGHTILTASATASGTLTLPAETGTLISTGSVGVVTAGLIADGTITNIDIAAGAGITYGKLSLTNSIVNADVAVGAAITYGKLSLSNSLVNADIATGAAIDITKLAASTISGISLGSNLNTLTFGTYLTGTSYNGSAAVTIATNATSANTGSTLVARDSSGNFSAGTITATLTGNASSATSASSADQIKTTTRSTAATHYLTFVDSDNGSATAETLYTDAGITYNPSTNDLTASGNVTAYSDISLKENIETISNALEMVNSLRGVRFNRKDLEGNPLQIGVVAQEVEKIVPEVVKTADDGLKSVAYGNLIGVLIEAIKELSAEVEELKSRQN